MSILESSIAPYLIILVVVAVLGGFFKHTLWKVVAFLVVMTALLAFFNPLLLNYLSLILSVRKFLGLPGA